jgi:hypothetical protein
MLKQVQHDRRGNDRLCAPSPSPKTDANTSPKTDANASPKTDAKRHPELVSGSAVCSVSGSLSGSAFA